MTHSQRGLNFKLSDLLCPVLRLKTDGDSIFHILLFLCILTRLAQSQKKITHAMQPKIVCFPSQTLLCTTEKGQPWALGRSSETLGAPGFLEAEEMPILRWNERSLPVTDVAYSFRTSLLQLLVILPCPMVTVKTSLQTITVPAIYKGF